MDPPIQNVKETEEVEFKCESSTQAVWYFNHKHLPPNAISMKRNVLHIHNVKKSNQGYYECRGTSDHLDSFSARGRLNVIG